MVIFRLISSKSWLKNRHFLPGSLTYQEVSGTWNLRNLGNFKTVASTLWQDQIEKRIMLWKKKVISKNTSQFQEILNVYKCFPPCIYLCAAYMCLISWRQERTLDPLDLPYTSCHASAGNTILVPMQEPLIHMSRANTNYVKLVYNKPSWDIWRSFLKMYNAWP